MVRKSAMILAGFLTAVVLVLAAMAFNVTTNWPVALGAQSPESIDEPESAASVYVTGIASQADEIYRQREAMLLTQVRSLQSSVTEQDSIYQAELARLQEALAEVEQAVKETTNDIGALDGLSSITQSRMQQNEAEYQQHLAQLQTRDSQMQQQLDAALVQLQAAYDQLAVQQTVQQDTYSSGSGGGQPNGSDENDHREHDDDDDHDDDDEHEGDEHGEDDDDDDD